MLWLGAGLVAAVSGVAVAGLPLWVKALLVLALLGALWWFERNAPRPCRLTLGEPPWRLTFTDGRECEVAGGTTTGLWPGMVILRCGWRRIPVFADQCSPGEFRHLKRELLAGAAEG